MSIRITEKDMTRIQKLLRQVFLTLGDVSEIEKRLAYIKKESSELYKRLDDIADGENQE